MSISEPIVLVVGAMAVILAAIILNDPRGPR